MSTEHVPSTGAWRIWATTFLVPVLAIVTALVIGAVIIVLTGADVVAAYGGLFTGRYRQSARHRLHPRRSYAVYFWWSGSAHRLPCRAL